MKTYFGILKSDKNFKEAEDEISQLAIHIIKYYPNFNAVKFETDRDLNKLPLDRFFQSVEEEKDDFTAF